MSLLDDFRSVLTGVRDLAESPTFKDAVGRDIAALENAAANGLAAVEAHVAGWFGAVYQADPGTGAVPVTPGSATPGVTATGTASAVAPSAAGAGTFPAGGTFPPPPPAGETPLPGV